MGALTSYHGDVSHTVGILAGVDSLLRGAKSLGRVTLVFSQANL